MSKPFEWKDFTKKYSDLASNNFPTLSKTKQVQDTIKFKFSSKAQKDVKFDSSITNYDATTTEADFSSKITLEEVNGVELSFKAKTKPSTEFTVKLGDELIPVPGASLTAKLASAEVEQTLGATIGYANQLINLNLGFSLPFRHKLFKFLNEENLTKQQPKADIDFVLKPVEEKDIFVGANASISLPTESSALAYTSKIALALNNKTFNGGLFVEHKKEKEKEHQSVFGGWACTEVDDLSGGAQVTYSPAESETVYKGIGFEAVAGIQRDNDSKLSSKVQIVPDTTVSLGYEQKLTSAIKLSFGYSFLLAKTTKETKTKASAFAFGLELSH
jgi:hypothetical protein